MCANWSSPLLPFYPDPSTLLCLRRTVRENWRTQLSTVVRPDSVAGLACRGHRGLLVVLVRTRYSRLPTSEWPSSCAHARRISLKIVRQTCTYLLAITDSTSAICLVVAQALYNISHTGPSSGMSPAEQLQRIVVRERSWDAFALRHAHNFVVPNADLVLRSLYRGTLAVGRVNPALSAQVTLFELPESPSRSVVERVVTLSLAASSTQVVGLCVDRTQDLIVIVVYLPEEVLQNRRYVCIRICLDSRVLIHPVYVCTRRASIGNLVAICTRRQS